VRVARLHAVGDLRVARSRCRGGPGMSLVRVTAVGICGSDLHWWDEGAIGDAKLTHPLVLGHEGAGVIADGPRRGERVAIDPAIPCETVPGVPRRLPEPVLPDQVFRARGDRRHDARVHDLARGAAAPAARPLSDADGAMLEPLGVAVHSASTWDTCRSAARRRWWAAGRSGCCSSALLKAAGASSVLAVEPLAHRREAAARYGRGPGGRSGRSFGDGLIRELTGAGVDVAFEAAGNDEGVGLAVESVRPGGRVVLAGIPGDDTIRLGASAARRKGLTIAMVRRMNEVYPRAISLAERGVVDLALGGDEPGGAWAVARGVRRSGPSHRAQGRHRAAALACDLCVRRGWRGSGLLLRAGVRDHRAGQPRGRARAWPASRRRHGRSWPGWRRLAGGPGLAAAVRALSPAGRRRVAGGGRARHGAAGGVRAGHGVAFVGVALAFLGLFLLGWRLVVRLFRRSNVAVSSTRWTIRYSGPSPDPRRTADRHQPPGLNGRTSIEPNRATGCLAATSIASAGLEHSITSYPAICSLVSANGPSLIRTWSSRTRTTAASRTGRSGPPSRRTPRPSISATQESVAGPTASLCSGLSWTFSATQISSR
jgi:L-iditol 2-dehydrogenase